MTLGIDIGEATLRVGLVEDQAVRVLHEAPVPDDVGQEAGLERVYALLERFPLDQAAGIGAAVTGHVDASRGLVRETPAVPGWSAVPFEALLEERYGKPAFVRSRAHCFALAEYGYGAGRRRSPLVGLVVNDGLRGGIVVDGTLLTGCRSGAGAFGEVPYKEGCYDQYCTGQFFERQYDTTAQAAYERAESGEAAARAMFAEMGTHLGRAVQSVLHAVDPACIVMGGRIRHAHPYFEEAMWEALEAGAAPSALDALTIQVSQLRRPGLLGAAALVTVHNDPDGLARPTG